MDQTTPPVSEQPPEASPAIQQPPAQQVPVESGPVQVATQPVILTPVVNMQPAQLVVAPKKKSLLWLWITLGVVALIMLLGMVLVILKLTSATKETPRNAVDDRLNYSASSTASGADFPLSKNISSPSDLAWAFPGSIAGWDITVFDQSGVNQLKKQNSQTLFTSYQMLKTGISATNDADASKQYLDDFITGLKSKSTVANQQDSTMTFPNEEGRSVEFAVRDYTYTTGAGEYKAKLVVRTTDKYSMSLLYAGLSSDVSDAEWQTLTHSVMLVGPIN